MGPAQQSGASCPQKGLAWGQWLSEADAHPESMGGERLSADCTPLKEGSGQQFSLAHHSIMAFTIFQHSLFNKGH